MDRLHKGTPMRSPSRLCLLDPPSLAHEVQRSLLAYDGLRYLLVCWAIMPDHVHVILSPLGRTSLTRILRTHKSFTAHRINTLTNRRGPVWHRESFDRVIRDHDDLA